MLAVGSCALGWALRHRHPDEALAALDQSVALARGGASTIVLPQALFFGAQVAAALSDADGARARLRDALEECFRNEDLTLLTISLEAAVDTFSYRGEARAAAVRRRRGRNHPGAASRSPPCRPRTRPCGPHSQPGPSPARTGRQLLRAGPRGRRHEPTRRPRLRAPAPVIPRSSQRRGHEPEGADPPPSHCPAQPWPTDRLGTPAWSSCV
jgi:hypothetical protein